MTLKRILAERRSLEQLKSKQAIRILYFLSYRLDSY